MRKPLRMTRERTVRRYAAYIEGWAQAFGSHEKAIDEQRDLRWLFGEEQVGLILTPEVKRFLSPQCLGDDTSRVPTLELSDGLLRIDSMELHYEASLGRPVETMREMLLGPDELYLYQTYHLIYPSGTRIATLSRRAPLPILYKEIAPLRLQMQIP